MQGAVSVQNVARAREAGVRNADEPQCSRHRSGDVVVHQRPRQRWFESLTCRKTCRRRRNDFRSPSVTWQTDGRLQSRPLLACCRRRKMQMVRRGSLVNHSKWYNTVSYIVFAQNVWRDSLFSTDHREDHECMIACCFRLTLIFIWKGKTLRWPRIVIIIFCLLIEMFTSCIYLVLAWFGFIMSTYYWIVAIFCVCLFRWKFWLCLHGLV